MNNDETCWNYTLYTWFSLGFNIRCMIRGTLIDDPGRFGRSRSWSWWPSSIHHFARDLGFKCLYWEPTEIYRLLQQFNVWTYISYECHTLNQLKLSMPNILSRYTMIYLYHLASKYLVSESASHVAREAILWFWMVCTERCRSGQGRLKETTDAEFFLHISRSHQKYQETCRSRLQRVTPRDNAWHMTLPQHLLAATQVLEVWWLRDWQVLGRATGPPQVSRYGASRRNRAGRFAA